MIALLPRIFSSSMCVPSIVSLVGIVVLLANFLINIEYFIEILVCFDFFLVLKFAFYTSVKGNANKSSVYCSNGQANENDAVDPIIGY
jgi:hypothetical protein